jgi:hypothetical protein
MTIRVWDPVHFPETSAVHHPYSVEFDQLNRLIEDNPRAIYFSDHEVEPERDIYTGSRTDVVLRHYAAQIEEVVAAGTYADHTWTGILGSFLNDVLLLAHDEIEQEIREEQEHLVTSLAGRIRLEQRREALRLS